MTPLQSTTAEAFCTLAVTIQQQQAHGQQQYNRPQQVHISILDSIQTVIESPQVLLTSDRAFIALNISMATRTDSERVDALALP